MKARTLITGIVIGTLLAFAMAAAASTIKMAGACGAPGADPCPTYISIRQW